MTKQEYKARIEGLEKQLAELKEAQINEPPELPKLPHPRWKPSKSEEWYAIGTHGSIRHYRADIDSLALDWCSTVANVYRSEDDAKFVIECRRVLAEMREWAGKNYDGAYIYYHKPSDEIMIGWSGDSTYCYGNIRFKCVDDAENCIKAVGADRIKKYYFMIPEEEKTDDER